MKAILFGVLRYLVIPVAFIWSLGIFNIHFSTGKPSDYCIFDSSDYRTLEIHPHNVIRYSDSIFRIRKEMIEAGKVYTPYLFFRDFKQFQMFEALYRDSLSSTYEGRALFLRCATGIGTSSQLVNLRDENWRIANLDTLEMSIDEARTYWFSNQEARLQANKTKSGKSFWSNIWNWLISSYFKGMIVAFFLFLLWINRFKKDCEDSFIRYEELKQFKNGFSLLSFLCALLVWPIILIRDIRNRSKDTLLKAEVLSRRHDMFSLLSKEEKQLIQLGRKIGLRKFRTHLNSKGLVRRHSLLAALCVLPILMFCSQHVVIQSDDCISEVSVSSNLSIDDDVGSDTMCVDSGDMCILKEITIPPLLYVVRKNIFFRTIFKMLTGFLEKPKGVPKCYLLITFNISTNILKNN